MCCINMYTKVCITATALTVVVIIMGYAKSDNKSRLWISTRSNVLVLYVDLWSLCSPCTRNPVSRPKSFDSAVVKRVNGRV